MIVNSSFRPLWWLSNRHAQTLYPTLVKKRLKPRIDFHERLELPDGDFIDLAWSVNELNKNTPLVILLHGLGGGINSIYVSGLMQAFADAGFRCVLMHFRGASEEPNRILRTYHSGDTADFAYFLEILAKREPATKKSGCRHILGRQRSTEMVGRNSIIFMGRCSCCCFRTIPIKFGG